MVRIEGCHINGIGGNANDIAGAYSLFLNSTGENYFKDCAIGSDTVGAGTNANSEILVDGSSARNFFDGCFIHRQIEHTTNHPLVKLVDANAIQSWMWFRNCMFHSSSVNYAIGQTGVFKLAAAITAGDIFLENCKLTTGDRNVTTTKWCADDRDNILVFESVVPPADTAGLSILV